MNGRRSAHRRKGDCQRSKLTGKLGGRVRSKDSAGDKAGETGEDQGSINSRRFRSPPVRTLASLGIYLLLLLRLLVWRVLTVEKHYFYSTTPWP